MNDAFSLKDQVALVTGSTKRRGFCPSYGARRMSQTAAHLVDQAPALPPGR